jgi:hypothetical protein
MRVLLVAPRTDLLLVHDEVEDIVRSGLTVTPLIRSQVNSDDLLREIKANDYDVLWLATHGTKKINVFGNTEYGIELSDGFMSASELVAQVRGRFQLVYLNTCTSFHIAQQIQEDANVTVIGTILDVPDRQAYQTASLFASALSEGMTAAQAYKRSKPGGERIYMFLAALEQSQDSIDTLLMELKNLRAEIERDRKLRAWLLIVAIGLHPVSWIVWLFVWLAWRV